MRSVSTEAKAQKNIPYGATLFVLRGIPIIVTGIILFFLTDGIPPAIWKSSLYLFEHCNQLWQEFGASVLLPICLASIQSVCVIVAWVYWFYIALREGIVLYKTFSLYSPTTTRDKKRNAQATLYVETEKKQENTIDKNSRVKQPTQENHMDQSQWIGLSDFKQDPVTSEPSVHHPMFLPVKYISEAEEGQKEVAPIDTTWFIESVNNNNTIQEEDSTYASESYDEVSTHPLIGVPQPTEQISEEYSIDNEEWHGSAEPSEIDGSEISEETLTISSLEPQETFTTQSDVLDVPFSTSENPFEEFEHPAAKERVDPFAVNQEILELFPTNDNTSLPIIEDSLEDARISFPKIINNINHEDTFHVNRNNVPSSTDSTFVLGNPFEGPLPDIYHYDNDLIRSVQEIEQDVKEEKERHLKNREKPMKKMKIWKKS